jgi:single-strand DNA-binding protein
MYNKVILIGNLTKDPEIRYTPQGTPVATFRLAVNSKFKSGDEMKQEALFIDIVVFGKQAEPVGQYLTKGSSALVEGRLQERKWEKEGKQHSKFEVVGQAVRFLLRKGGQTSEGAGADIPEENSELEPF